MPSSTLSTTRPSALEDLVGSPGFFQRCGELACRISSADSETEGLAILQQLAHCLGATSALFCTFMREPPLQMRWLLACDPSWYMAYERDRAFECDPWLAYASQYSDPVCGSQIPVTSQPQRSTLELARRHGFESSVVVPAPSTGNQARVGVLVLGSPIAGYFEGAGYTAVKVMARTLAMELHEWHVSQVRRELMSQARLTPDDLELLRMKRNGCINKQIAAELGVSSTCINTRMNRLFKRLGVHNCKAGAELAVSIGLV